MGASPFRVFGCPDICGLGRREMAQALELETSVLMDCILIEMENLRVSGRIFFGGKRTFTTRRFEF